MIKKIKEILKHIFLYAIYNHYLYLRIYIKNTTNNVLPSSAKETQSIYWKQGHTLSGAFSVIHLIFIFFLIILIIFEQSIVNYFLLVIHDNNTEILELSKYKEYYVQELFNLRMDHHIIFNYFDISLYRFILFIILFFSYFFYLNDGIIKIIHNNLNKTKKIRLLVLFIINITILFFSLILLVHSVNLLSIITCIEIINITLYFFILLQKKEFFAVLNNKQEDKENTFIQVISQNLWQYFLNNALFTSFYLFGSALIFFQLNTLNLNTINYFFIKDIALLNDPITLLGILFICISFFFKLGFFGFHKLLYTTYNNFNKYTYNFIGVFIKFFFFQSFALIYTLAFRTIYKTPIFYLLLAFLACSIILPLFFISKEHKIIGFFFFSSISNYSLSFLMVVLINLKQANFFFYYNFHYFFFSFLFFLFLSKIENTFLNKKLIYINQLYIIKYINIWYKLIFQILVIVLVGFPIFPIFLGKFSFLISVGQTYVLSIIIYTATVVIINMLLTFVYFYYLIRDVYINEIYKNEEIYKIEIIEEILDNNIDANLIIFDDDINWKQIYHWYSGKELKDIDKDSIEFYEFKVFYTKELIDFYIMFKNKTNFLINFFWKFLIFSLIFFIFVGTYFIFNLFFLVFSIVI